MTVLLLPNLLRMVFFPNIFRRGGLVLHHGRDNTYDGQCNQTATHALVLAP